MLISSEKIDLYELFLPPFLKERVAPKNFNEGKAWVKLCHVQSFCSSFFQKACGFQRRSLGRSSQRAKSPKRRFSFWLEQERARWAMKRVRSTEKTRSIECDLAFKATMFLTGQAFSFATCVSKEKALLSAENLL
jgi:hypothetical protein